MSKRYNKKILTTTHQIESKILLEQRINKIAKIIMENQTNAADCPDGPIESIKDLFSDTLDSFNPHGESAAAVGGVEQSIVNWGKRVEDKIGCLSHNDALRLFGGGYVATFVTDFYDMILEEMGVTDDDMRGVIKIALLSITAEEIPDIVSHWNKSSMSPDGSLSGTIPGSANHPANPDGGWYGCEKVAWAILTGALSQYGIVKVKSMNTLRSMAGTSKIANTIVGLFATGTVVRALEISALATVMEMSEVKVALDEITAEVCEFQDMASVMGMMGTIGNIGRRLRDEIGEELDDGELPDPVPNANPVPGAPAPSPAPAPAPAASGCPTGEIKNTSGVCIRDPLLSVFEVRKLSLNGLREKLNIRGGKGYSTGHPFIDRKPPNIGTSVVQNFLNNKEKKNKDKDTRKMVKISKAFTRKNNDNI